MSSDVLRIGMIGCGEIAYRAAAPAVLNAGLELTAAMDTVEDVARSFGDEFECAWTTDVDTLLARPDVDAVCISTPHYLHAPLTVKAAAAGKHVVVEKPIACTLEQADEMIEACRRAGVLLSVAYVTRYAATVRKARELVRSGVIGDVLGIHMHMAYNKTESYWHQGYSGRVQTDWRCWRDKSGGGVLMMNGSHAIDRIRWITGLEAERVYAEIDTYATEVEVEDFAMVTLRYDNGAMGSIFAGSAVRGGQGTGERIMGTEGQIQLGRPLRVYTRRDVPDLECGVWNDVEVSNRVDARARHWEEFARAITRGKPVPVSGEDARKTLEQIVAAYESGRTHQPVLLGALA